MGLKVDLEEIREMNDEDLGAYFRYKLEEEGDIEFKKDDGEFQEKMLSWKCPKCGYVVLEKNVTIAPTKCPKCGVDMTGVKAISTGTKEGEGSAETKGAEFSDASFAELLKHASGIQQKEKEIEIQNFDETVTLENIAVFEIGLHNGQTFVTADLDEMVTNHQQLKGVIVPPLKLGHKGQKFLKNEGYPAAGWMTDLVRKGNVLYATFNQVPKRIYALIKKGAWKRPSIELYSNFKDKTGKVFGKVLGAVALLGSDIPAVKLPVLDSLSDVENLYNEAMDQNEVEVIQFNFEEIDPNKEGGEKMALTPEQIKELQEKATTFETGIAEKESEITKLNEAMKQKDNAIKDAAKEKRAAEITIFLETAKADGRILPIFESHLQVLLESADSEKIKIFEEDKEGNKIEKEMTQFDLIKDLVNRLPKMVEFGELSSSEDGKKIKTMSEEEAKKEYGVEEGKNEVLSGLELHDLAEKKVEEKKISYNDALVEVFQEQKKTGNSNSI